MRGADVVCAPSLLEPFGQSILEAMATGKTVVATRFGGPPEFVTPEAGHPRRSPRRARDLGWALEAALAFPAPERRRRVRQPPSTTSGFRRSGWRRSCFEPLKIGEPDLDERPDRLLDAGVAREFERLLVALAHLGRVDALLQAIVPGQQRLVYRSGETLIHDQ